MIRPTMNVMRMADMEPENPHEYKGKPNRIYNWPWAIFFIVFGFGLGISGAVWLWMSWSGGGGLFTDLTTGSEWAMDVILTIVLGFGVILLFWIGFAAPVFWSEIGEKLVFRKLLGAQRRKWSDIKAMKFDEDKCKNAVTTAWRKRSANKTLEITLFEDDVELIVVIPPSHYDRIVKLAAEHGFVLDESEPDVGGAGETGSGPSQVVSESPPEAAPEPPQDAAKPSEGVTRVFEILTASAASAPRTVKRTSKSTKS